MDGWQWAVAEGIAAGSGGGRVFWLAVSQDALRHDMGVQSYGDGDGGCWCGTKLVREGMSGMDWRDELGGLGWIGE